MKRYIFNKFCEFKKFSEFKLKSLTFVSFLFILLILFILILLFILFFKLVPFKDCVIGRQQVYNFTMKKVRFAWSYLHDFIFLLELVIFN